MVEKPSVDEAPSTLSIMGRYVLQPEIFDILEKTGEGAGGEIQLTDAMDALMEKQSFYAATFEGETHDCGSKLGFIKANVAFGLDRGDFGGDLKAWLANQ
ncbi:MAG: sugar phosphate nucleotidyltransferase, partial [Pseudomonadota bacterium]